MVDGLVFVIQFTCLLIDNHSVRHGFLDTLQQRMLVVVGRCAAVVTVQQFDVVGIGANDGNGLDALRQWQNVLVFQQYHRFTGSLYGHVVVLLAGDCRSRNLRPRQHVGRVEHAQLEASFQRVAQVLVEFFLCDESLLQTFLQRHEHLAAFQVGTIQHSIDRGRETVLVRLVLTTVEEVVDGVAVSKHDGIVAPFVAQDVYQ